MSYKEVRKPLDGGMQCRDHLAHKLDHGALVLPSTFLGDHVLKDNTLGNKDAEVTLRASLLSKEMVKQRPKPSTKDILHLQDLDKVLRLSLKNIIKCKLKYTKLVS